MIRRNHKSQIINHKYKKNFEFRILKLGIFCCVLFLQFLPRPSQALTISPPIFDLRAAPGEVLNTALNLENETSGALNLYGSVEAFNPAAKKGDSEFYPSGEGLPSWIALGESAMSLAPGESKKVSLKISVPAETTGGSYYAAVFWGTSPGNVPSGAAVGARLGCLIFLSVDGAVIQNLEITNFQTVKKINTIFPAIFETTLKNGGNTYLAPKGEIVIRNWIGKQVAALPWNDAGLRVLPGAERTIQAKWGEHAIWPELKLGIWGFYRASISISYGVPAKEIGDTASFWILPLPSLGIFLSVVVLIILIIRFVLQRYNRWIIKKHLGS